MAEVSESDIEAMVQNLREQRPSFNVVDRESHEGDRVTMDFEGLIDAKEFEGDATGDPFFTQVLLHHFDDIDEIIADGTIDNEFNADNIFLDEEYWSYPVVSVVDMED